MMKLQQFVVKLHDMDACMLSDNLCVSIKYTPIHLFAHPVWCEMDAHSLPTHQSCVTPIWHNSHKTHSYRTITHQMHKYGFRFGIYSKSKSKSNPIGGIFFRHRGYFFRINCVCFGEMCAIYSTPSKSSSHRGYFFRVIRTPNACFIFDACSVRELYASKTQASQPTPIHLVVFAAHRKRCAA